jgi:hypothetical protein
MDAKKPEPKKLSMSSTKQEMLDAYHAALKELREKEETELRPEKKLEEKKKMEVLKVADSVSSLSVDGIARGIAGLRADVAKTLGEISDNVEREADKFRKMTEAVQLKEREIQELYAIEKEAVTLAALVEAQQRRRQEFDSKMAQDKEDAQGEIESTRHQWESDKKARDVEAKEWDTAEKKRREREKEEYEYAFKREQRLAKEGLQDQKAKLEREMSLRKEELETDLAGREVALAAREQELADLQKKASMAPKEMEAAVTKAVKEATERLTGEAKNREEIMKREFEGERNVLKSKIESLEATVKEQRDQITKLSQQLDKSYQKVEELAVKALETSSTAQSVAGLQQMITEQGRRQPQDK